MSSNAEKHREVVRELKMRKKVYPRWVTQGRLSLPQADYQIRIMEEIAEDYRKLADDEPELFSGSKP